MKEILIILFGCVLLSSCEDSFSCDCDYVTYDSDPTNNYVWTETYRSSWDTTCEDELMDESTYTDSEGQKWYSRTEIDCK